MLGLVAVVMVALASWNVDDPSFSYATSEPAQNWLGDQRTALGAVTLVAVWKEAGFFMIFYLAALQGLPQALAEAADANRIGSGALGEALDEGRQDGDDYTHRQDVEHQRSSV
mgnify:CR=1 FL=1